MDDDVLNTISNEILRFRNTKKSKAKNIVMNTPIAENMISPKVSQP